MDLLIARCAGSDVHKETPVACARRIEPDGRVTQQTRTFGAMTAAVLARADWLAEAGVTHVAMEATGVYWEPVYSLLEDRFTLLLVHAQHVKKVPGRKTDVKDAEGIAHLLQCGRLRGSFVPPRPVRAPRDLTRQRAPLVAEKAAVANRIQEVLEGANIKRAGVATDVRGASGRARIEALVAGRDDPGQWAEWARGRRRGKRDRLRQALDGRVTEHHRFLLGSLMDQVRSLEGRIERYDRRVAEVMAPFAEAERRLRTIPGVGARAAEVITAAIGADMSRFPSAGHRCSWAGMSPGNEVSAGRRRSGRATKGSRWLRAVLVQVGWAAIRTRGTIFQASYRRWVKRRGPQKALIAVARKILTIAYELLKDRKDYEERAEPARLAA